MHFGGIAPFTMAVCFVGCLRSVKSLPSVGLMVRKNSVIRETRHMRVGSTLQHVHPLHSYTILI